MNKLQKNILMGAKDVSNIQRVDGISKKYGLSSQIEYEDRKEYAFPDRECLTRKGIWLVMSELL